MKMRRLLEDTEKINKTETQNFFAAIKSLHEARHAGASTDEFIDELEVIALRTEQPFLRKRAQQIVAEHTATKEAAECAIISPSVPAR